MDAFYKTFLLQQICAIFSNVPLIQNIIIEKNIGALNCLEITFDKYNYVHKFDIAIL